MVEHLLDVEINDEFEVLSKMEKGSETYKATVDGLTKLIDRAIEIEKVQDERERSEQTRKDEEKFRQQQFESERKDRWIKNALTATGIIVPSVITIWGTLKSLKFEETGTITTAIGRGFINKLLPKK
jgi:hypothetical protein